MMSQVEVAPIVTANRGGGGGVGNGRGGRTSSLSISAVPSLRVVSEELMDTEDVDSSSDDGGEPKLEICEDSNHVVTSKPARSSPIAVPLVSKQQHPFLAAAAGAPKFGDALDGHSSSGSGSSGYSSSSSMSKAKDSDAIESLLMLGRESVFSPQTKFRQRGHSFSTHMPSSPQLPVPCHRRYSSGSELSLGAGDVNNILSAASDNIVKASATLQTKTQGSYYLKMRERNNEASKRCRLKRRMKAESLENQGHLLSISNRLLRQRVAFLQEMGDVLREGVARSKNDGTPCECEAVMSSLRQICERYADSLDASNRTLVENSESCRQGAQALGVMSNSVSSEDEGLSRSPPSSSSNAPPLPQPPPSTTMITISTSNANNVVKAQPIQMTAPQPVPTATGLGPAAGAPVLQIVPTFAGRSELSVTPVVQQQPQAAQPLPNTEASRTLTALDVINDTIVRSLSCGSKPVSAPQPVPAPTAAPPPPASGVVAPSSAPPMPLNLVKIIPPVVKAAPLPAAPPKQIILLPSGAQAATMRRKRSSSASAVSMTRSIFDGSEEQVQVKCEPEIQLVECEPPPAQAVGGEDAAAVDPTLPHVECVAATAHGRCSGDLLDLSKLTGLIDLATRMPAAGNDLGFAALEKAVIKSGLGIAFWKDDEAPSYICSHHRFELVHRPNRANCAVCGKSRSKKVAPMMTITFRMSLQYYTRSGNILAIGSLVCGQCRDKSLRGVDMTHSQVVSGPVAQVEDPEPIDPAKLKSSMSITPVQKEDVRLIVQQPKASANNGLQKDRKPLHLTIPSNISSMTSSSVLLTPSLSSTSSSSPPPSSASTAGTPGGVSLASPSSADFIGKMGRLNDALQALNPSYKPIGFSITSLESCSESVLKDAVAATETAVTTLLSVIAPGQESFLWKAIKPSLDEKLRLTKAESP